MLEFLIESGILWLGLVVLAFVWVYIVNEIAKKFSWDFLVEYGDVVEKWAIEQGKNDIKREEAMTNIVNDLFVFLPKKFKIVEVTLDFVSKFTPVDSLKVKLVKMLNALYGDVLDLLDDGKNNQSID